MNVEEHEYSRKIMKKGCLGQPFFLEYGIGIRIQACQRLTTIYFHKSNLYIVVELETVHD